MDGPEPHRATLLRLARGQARDWRQVPGEARGKSGVDGRIARRFELFSWVDGGSSLPFVRNISDRRIDSQMDRARKIKNKWLP
jgi:hypothetical protein